MNNVTVVLITLQAQTVEYGAGIHEFFATEEGLEGNTAPSGGGSGKNIAAIVLGSLLVVVLILFVVAVLKRDAIIRTVSRG